MSQDAQPTFDGKAAQVAVCGVCRNWVENPEGMGQCRWFGPRHRLDPVAVRCISFVRVRPAEVGTE